MFFWGLFFLPFINAKIPGLSCDSSGISLF
nr:MAG TPA: hypothetical protein [Caudoviricetes sp.]